MSLKAVGGEQNPAFIFRNGAHRRKRRNCIAHHGCSDRRVVPAVDELEELNEELEILNAEARELEERISENVAMLLEDGR